MLEYKNVQMNERGYKFDPEDQVFRTDTDKVAHLM